MKKMFLVLLAFMFMAGGSMAVNMDLIAGLPGEDLESFGGFIKLNETGAFIFNLLREEISKEEIVTAVLGEYDVSEEQAIKSTEEFLSYLSSFGVI